MTRRATGDFTGLLTRTRVDKCALITISIEMGNTGRQYSTPETMDRDLIHLFTFVRSSYHMKSTGEVGRGYVKNKYETTCMKWKQGICK